MEKGHTKDVPLLKGLSYDEVIKKREEGQGNDTKIKTSRSYKEILKENLFTFFNMALFIIGLALLLFGKVTESIITSGVVFINITIAVIQEIKAKKKLDKIALLTKPKARVIREEKEEEINPEEIVLGDILIAGPGDQIMVDSEIIKGSIDLDESLLTGETDLVSKKEKDNLYSGSFCISGQAYYEAKKVGADSYSNKLTANARTFTRQYTPLQKEINLIIRVLLAVIVFFSILIFIRAFIANISILESIRATSVLFGLAPNSLFLMIVIAYALGALRIANKGALVQQANSVESLCNVTILCLDKTGTLTANKINFNEITPLQLEISKEEIENILGIFARSTSVNNPTGDAISKAFNGIKVPFKEEISFSSALKWSALSFEHEKIRGTFVLGAYEMLKDNLKNDDNIEVKIKELTSQGLRVLLFTYLPNLSLLKDTQDNPKLPDKLIPLCLISFSDQLRPNVKKTLKSFYEAGIELKIISGDNPYTVESLVRQTGLESINKNLRSISGPELNKMDNEQFNTAVKSNTIFGRITPQQKEKIVKTLKSQGHYVAMTGDGVNDVLALKQADLGIAMQSGSQATRSVAGIILLNDSFSVLPEAFKEGQRILNGMEDIFKLYMTRILYLTVLIVAIAFIDAGFPFTPKQSSIISILTLSIPSFALALWARPGPVNKGTLTRKMMHFVIPALITMSIAGLFVYLYFLIKTFLETGVANLNYAQHTLTYTTLLCGFSLIIFVEPPTKEWVGGDSFSGDWRPTFLSIGMLLVFIAFLVIPSWRNFYSLILLSPIDYIVIIAVTFIWAISVHYTWKNLLIDKYLNVNL